MARHEDHDDFAKRLRAARRKAKLSQEQLAKRIGVSQPTVCAWEAGADIKRRHYVRVINELPDLVAV